MYRPSWISCYMKIGWIFNLGPHPTGQKSSIFSRKKRERRLEGNLFTLTFALFKASRILAWEWINAPSRSVLGRLSANWDAIAIAEEFKDWKRAQVWKSEFHTKLHHFDVTGSPQGGRGEDLDKKFKQLVCKFWSNRGNMAPGTFLFPEAPLQPCVLDISWESINGGHWINTLHVVQLFIPKDAHCWCFVWLKLKALVYPWLRLHQRADHQVHRMEDREGN